MKEIILRYKNHIGFLVLALVLVMYNKFTADSTTLSVIALGIILMVLYGWQKQAASTEERITWYNVSLLKKLWYYADGYLVGVYIVRYLDTNETYLCFHILMNEKNERGENTEGDHQKLFFKPSELEIVKKGVKIKSSGVMLLECSKNAKKTKLYETIAYFFSTQPSAVKTLS